MIEFARMKGKGPNIRILAIRGQKVVLDSDRFPQDFAFQLTSEEFRALRSQFAPLDEGFATKTRQRSQNATLKPRRGWYRKYRPWAFTEHGALQVANFLRSDRAIAMSVYVIRAFIEQREKLAANTAILKRLAEIDRTLLEHDTALRDIYQKLLPLLAPPEPPRRQIGFSAAS